MFHFSGKIKFYVDKYIYASKFDFNSQKSEFENENIST